MANDFIFRGSARECDPDLYSIIAGEDRRQTEKVILIASESIAPAAVRELMGSNFANIYAEGYPPSWSRIQTQSQILDIDKELAHFRRYSDPRYYKGVEYANILEALTRRRAAELFAENGIAPEDLHINVQPLSGSPANSAVYSALLEPGDKLMGLNLNHGGHLTHGSKVSRSGRLYQAIPYTLNLETEQLDYDAIEALALQHQPKLIVAGFTAYPLQIDWSRFRAIADSCGAYLMADIAHVSGLVAAGVHSSPIGIADIVTTTTHKSLCGPRGAMIMTHKLTLSRKIDKAVFPGEQGGPHLNTIAGLALALKLAKSDQFRNLMKRVVSNASRLAEQLQNHGFRVMAGRSENHLVLVDTKSVKHDGVHLSGDIASRILDVAGIVTNSNTIPGDRNMASASGIRMGTVWVSQLGYGAEEIDRLAEAIAVVLNGCKPFAYAGRGKKRLLRAKIEHTAMKFGRDTVRSLSGNELIPEPADVVEVRGSKTGEFLDLVLSSDVLGLGNGDSQMSRLYRDEKGTPCDIYRKSKNLYYLLFNEPDEAVSTAQWLQDLSDGYLFFDDLYAKLPGPIIAKTTGSFKGINQKTTEESPVRLSKPYFIGRNSLASDTKALPPFHWQEPSDRPLRQTRLHSTHRQLGGRMVPFGGWDMPVWYSSVGEEHAAVRETAGLFDVSHMGVLEAAGPHAESFLNQVTTNDVSALDVGESQYTYLLMPDGTVVDDLLIYKRGQEKFMMVVNAANNDKDWAWLNAVNEGLVQIDSQRPGAHVQHPATLRDLRDPRWADECLVDLALQGPKSTEILLELIADEALAQEIKTLPWARLTEGKIAGLEVVISRTGYTGERKAFELFVHPDQAPQLWAALLQAGGRFGLKPCGLASRDSTRTEAGLPLYGHELAGPLDLNPGDAGFGSYVKLWKPFFIGREPFIEHEKVRDVTVVRFRMDEKGVRRSELGDPVLDKRGRVIGKITSCAIDSEGYLLGQALVTFGSDAPGSSIAIYQLGGGKRKLRLPSKSDFGTRFPLADRATVLSRFPAVKR